MDNKIKFPILIVGSARSGKSLLGNFLSLHRDTCWFSNYSDKFPENPASSIIHRMIELPIIGKIIKKSIISQNPKRFFPRPTEGEIIYHSYCKLPRHRIGNDAIAACYSNDKSAEMFKKSVSSLARYHGKERFITDQSDNAQRIRLIDKLIGPSYVIHVVRDGRAVAHEVVLSKWWKDVWIWWYGKTPQDSMKEGIPSIVMSGKHWIKVVSAVYEDIESVKDRYMEIRYEDLTENPRKTIRRVVEFCDLLWYKEFESYIPEKIKNYNYRWKNEMTCDQIVLLENEIDFFLSSLGYI